jgi:Arc/MetJ-type ribon-helix-helix transcriptional regulator
MVKSTVRFPEPVVEEIESLVDEGQFESKSEFYRFSADYVLSRTLDEYEPSTIDYDAIESEVIPETERKLGGDGEETGEPPFFDSVAFVRKLALRGRFSDAEDFIDHQYVPGDRHAVLLEEVLRLYREDAAGDGPRPAEGEDRRPRQNGEAN